MPTGVATLDADAKIPTSQLPNLLSISAPAASTLAPTRRPKPCLEDTTVIFNASPGHGWTLVNGTNSTTSEDTGRRGPFSDRSIRISRTTENTELAKYGLSVDLSAGPLTIWAYLPDANPKGILVQAGDGGENFLEWDRYGNDGGGSDSPHVDGWTAFELYPSDAVAIGTPDPGHVTSIKVRASGNDTTIWVAAIAQRPNPTSLYPNGVCTVFFDDGYDSIYTLGMPVLAKYGDSAVMATICDVVDKPTWVTTAQLHELQERCGWEIAAHASTLAAHHNRFSALDASQLDTEFSNLKSWLVSRGFNTDTWISPGGISSTAIWDTCRKYFSVHRSVAPAGAAGTRYGSQWNSPRPMYPAFMPSPNFGTATSTKADLLATLDGIKANKSWGSLTFHQVINGPSWDQQINVADLDDVIGYAHAIGVPIRTVNRVLKEVN